MFSVHRGGTRTSRLRRAAIVATAFAVTSTSALFIATKAEAAAGCRVTYTISSQWPGGFGANIDPDGLFGRVPVSFGGSVGLCGHV
ncbi:hypothetical protein ACFHVL_26245, partial [Micromonospora sp. LOL_023]